MQLCVQDEKLEDNAHDLIDTIPQITRDDKKIRLTSDQGYGTMRFIQKATEKNIRFQLLLLLWDQDIPNKFLEDCRAMGDSFDELVEKYTLYESWIGLI